MKRKIAIRRALTFGIVAEMALLVASFCTPGGPPPPVTKDERRGDGRRGNPEGTLGIPPLIEPLRPPIGHSNLTLSGDDEGFAVFAG